ncbi:MULTISPECIES: pyridoxal phosphate-dependent aminotransferase [Ectothiorhodospira]|uniref:pyridoxal phosphate-dependent aminotransferase n=1 Tax=Ectothiorhodospira TaxID=1051 RepID=UPI00024A89FC|nr:MULTISPECIES: pyridoxal phosphate-dependent aminotransferase [Ectothiorhodospira]EHQ53667.1 class I and II aminotransferase [Ectothiorhodospira sp. PHS-1]MCG5512571.1 pyridoxal phosphate-dependent aminotransferase [Ectothiorhodospira shaposhnikovii]
MDIKLSSRVQRIKPSPTLAVTALAAQLRAQGRDVIGLGAGEPDFHTPDPIKEAGIAAIRNNKTRYTAVDGTPGLKQAIIDKFKRDNGHDFQPDQILVSCGGKQSFFNLAQALLNEGDEVIIPAPYWVSYPDMVLLADGKPVIVSADQSQGFKMTPEQLEAAITPRTRLVVINSPSNPTGVAYSREELAALGEVLLRHPHVLVATDDMYEHMMFRGVPFVNILMACPALYDRTIVLNGVSKAYAMTGWRIGYAGGPKALISAMKKIQSQSTSNPTSIAQEAAEAALNGDQGCVGEMCKAFEQRHDYLVAALNAIPGVECLPSDGTFYSFPSVKGAMEKLGMDSDVKFSEYLLDKVGVALVPGSAFGADGHVRISFATSMDNLKQAVERIARAVEGE